MIFKVKTETFSFDYNKYANNINEKYIENIKIDKKNRMIIHCMDNNKENITSFIIYRKSTLKKENNYYILLIGVHEKIRNYGYGKIILDDFIEYINKKKIYNNLIKKNNLIIHSLISSESFFLQYGFIKKVNSRFLRNYEGWKEDKNKLIYKYLIN